jgi:coproporphyrinogen III oxidase-like Fe-S oxidoreductase
VEPPLAASFDWALDAGLLTVTDDRIVLTTRGRLLSNELFSRLV